MGKFEQQQAENAAIFSRAEDRRMMAADTMQEATAGLEMRGRLLLNADVEKFALAGNATITIVSVATGKRYTFKVSKPQDFDVARPIWFVSTLKGSDNMTDFGYIGEIIFRGGIYAYRQGRKCWRVWYAASEAFNWFWHQTTFRVEPDVNPSIEVWHEGRCGRCGRKLTVPESIESGYGPECRELV